MKNLFAAMLIMVAPGYLAADAVRALPGAPGVMELGDAPPVERQKITAKPEPRDFTKQPPLVPHNVQGLLIQTRVNMCLACHARRTEQRSNAAKLPDSHYLDRAGATSEDIVAPRRWFCTQCHVPQADVAPLVKNNYRGAKLK